MQKPTAVRHRSRLFVQKDKKGKEKERKYKTSNKDNKKDKSVEPIIAIPSIHHDLDFFRAGWYCTQDRPRKHFFSILADDFHTPWAQK
jgi:hypothetical protein